jgi:Flp pilus assembly protein TadD
MRKSMTFLSLAALLSVAGCKTTETDNNVPFVGKALDSLNGMHDETEARLSTAANNAIAEGKTGEALELYSRLYDKDRTEDTALNYAQLLRKTGKPEAALKVIGPFIYGRDGTIKGTASPILLNEYAAANIGLGKYDLAENVLNSVIENKNATSAHRDSYDLLGIVLDAKGKHKEAEQSYHQALDGWKGDPTAVMNNLGLCLAAQGKFDQSLTTLRQALIKAPHKEEIARNIKMVSDLQKGLQPKTPISVVKKPKHPKDNG